MKGFRLLPPAIWNKYCVKTAPAKETLHTLLVNIYKPNFARTPLSKVLSPRLHSIVSLFWFVINCQAQLFLKVFLVASLVSLESFKSLPNALRVKVPKQ